MNAFLLLLITLAQALDMAWQPYAGQVYSSEKSVLAPYVQEISETYVEVGVPYLRRIGFEYRPFPGKVLGATLQRGDKSCMQAVALNTALRYRHNPFYGTPITLATLAHEVGHVYQGFSCGDPDAPVETGAEVAMYIILAKMAQDDKLAEAALVYELRRESILAALDGLQQAGRSPDELLSHLELTASEEMYFRSWLEDPSFHKRSQWYWTGALKAILGADSDQYCHLHFGRYREGPFVVPVCLDGGELNDRIQDWINK